MTKGQCKEGAVRNIKLVLAYDGGRYHGFQRQNNAIAVQNVLEKKLAPIFGHAIEMAASGRTDTGVHAYGQVVTFLTKGTIPIDCVVRAANSHLPPDIVVKMAEEVPLDFSARFSAKSKIYLYKIQQGAILDPFSRNYAWYIRKPLDVDAMNRALGYTIGTHDFSAFQAAGSAAIDPVRTIYEAVCVKNGDRLAFSFWGNGFLYHMVRNIMGTVVNVGKGKIPPEAFIAIMAGKDRRKAGATAPAQGLYLQEVHY